MEHEIPEIINQSSNVKLYHDPKLLAEFMDQPKVKIAEAITGALALGTGEAIQLGARVIQSVIKGTLFKQLGREIKDLIEAGKIKEDYANEKYSFQSLADILQFIDSEAPDEDRFLAIKALFFSIISIDATEGEKVLNYQLFKIAMGLSAGQLLILKISYDLRKNNENIGSSKDDWLTLIAKKAGHNLKALIEDDEIILIEKHLISPRLWNDKSGVDTTNARLTDLGIKLSSNLEKFATEQYNSSSRT
jgi:hypothetical protein